MANQKRKKNRQTAMQKGAKVSLLLTLFIFGLVSLILFSVYSVQQKRDGRTRAREIRPTRALRPSITPRGDGTPQSGSWFTMAQPTLESVCDYPQVFANAEKISDPSFLTQAQSCGTHIVMFPYNKTEEILNDNGIGINLTKFEEKVQSWVGKIEPYIRSKTITYIAIIDEPHDCNNDWGGVCPSPEEVDEAGRITKQYFPQLPVAVNTLARFANGYSWQHIDVISFQYAVHKGPIDEFIAESIAVKQNGFVPDIAWALQAYAGGCETFQECPMTPEQVLEYGKKMCDADKGQYMGFVRYKPDLLTTQMNTAIADLSSYCKR